MGCVDFTRLRWPSQIWVFEGSLSIASSIPFAGSGTTGHAVLQLNASSGMDNSTLRIVSEQNLARRHLAVAVFFRRTESRPHSELATLDSRK